MAANGGAAMTTFLEDFTRDIPRGLSSRYLKQQTAPQARWQTPEVILERKALEYDPRNPGGRFLIGARGPKLVGIEDNRHVLTVAGSRAGKSVNADQQPFILSRQCAGDGPEGRIRQRHRCPPRRARAEGPRPRSLRERIAPAHLCKSYNPLAILKADSPTIIEDAGLIADALVVRTGQEKDPHWDESARNFIEGVILHVATDSRYGGRRNLLTARDLLRTALKKEPAGLAGEDEEPLHLLEKEMLQSAAQFSKNVATEDLGGALEGAARDFYEKGDTERAGVLSTVRRHTKFLDYTAMRRVLAGHDFDLADLKRDRAGVSVYLCLPASRMGVCNRWLRIFINQLLDAMEREKTAPAAPVLVCLDELPVLGHMRHLEDAAGQIASFGVKLRTVLQDWGQGKTLYKERWETFAGNAGILQFFGNNDLETPEYVSRRLGKTRIEVARQGEVGPEQAQSGLSGRSASMELHDLLTPDEGGRNFLRSDRLKRQLVIWAGYDPMVLQRVEYFDNAGPHWAVFKGTFSA
jgi:type IV secretion system protein VirD4